MCTGSYFSKLNTHTYDIKMKARYQEHLPIGESICGEHNKKEDAHANALTTASSNPLLRRELYFGFITDTAISRARGETGRVGGREDE